MASLANQEVTQWLRHWQAGDERKARVVELRFFGGLSVEDTGEALGVSGETIAREWRFAKLWLQEVTKGVGDD